MSKFRCLLLQLSIVVLFYSCVPHKKIIYLQNTGEVKSDTIITMKNTYKIQPGDVLSVQISSFNPATTDFFNSKTEGKQGGYLVLPSGYMRFPILDSVYVKDLTIIQTQDTLTKLVGEHSAKPFIIVNLANFKFTTLGEFGSKGIIESANNELTILEALALAGDMSDLADKANIKLIRKEGSNSVFVTLNLNNRDIMQSKYYYIHPNDILYAQPLKVKALRTNISQLTTYFGLFSFALLVYNLISSRL